MANPFDQFDQKGAPNPFDQFDAKGRGLGESTARGFGLTAQGINEAIANIIGTPGDVAKAGYPVLPNDVLAYAAKTAPGLINKLGEQTGLYKTNLPSIDLPIGSPTRPDVKKGMDFISTLPRRAVDTVSGAPEPQGGYSSRVNPENAMERFVYGGGQAVGDTLAWLMGAGAISAAAPVASVAGNVARSVMTAPGTQLLSNVMGTGVSEATQNPLYGLAAALGTGAVIEAGKPVARYLAAPGRSTMNEVDKRLANVLADEGVRLRTGQMTGSKGVQVPEAVLERLPISGPMAAADIRKQREAFTAAAMRRLDMQTSSAAPEELLRFKAKYGATVNPIIERTTLNVDDPMVEGMIKVADKYQGVIPENTKGIVKRYLDQLTLPKGGQIPGEEYQRTRSLLYNQAKGFKDSDYTTYRALKDIRNVLDEAFARSVAPADAEAFKTANRQYANFKVIENAMNRQGEDIARGILTPGALEAAAKKAAKGLYSSGAGDFNDLARAGSLFLKDKVPTSGTAERLWYQSLLTGGMGGAMGFDPLTLGASVAIPPAAEKILQSDMMKRYLMKPRGTNQTDIQGLLAAALAERLRDPNTKAIR